MQIRFDPARSGQTELHFSRELPVFPSLYGRFGCSRALSRASRLQVVADVMGRRNRGFFHVETDPNEEIFLRFLGELVLIEGLSQVIEASRYCMQIEIGTCFDAAKIVQAIGDCVSRFFYGGEAVEVIDSSQESSADSIRSL